MKRLTISAALFVCALSYGFLNSSRASAKDEQYKAGTRVVTDYFGTDGAEIEEVGTDGKYTILPYSEFGPMKNNITKVEKKYILGKEVASFKGVKKGQSAVCKHLYGEFTAKVSHVYDNGFVELDLSKGSTTYHRTDLVMNGVERAKIAWSAVPGNKEAPKLGYPCDYSNASENHKRPSSDDDSDDSDEVSGSNSAK